MLWSKINILEKLTDIEHHHDIVKRLNNLKYIDNMLFFGPSGSGKLTIVKLMLKNILNIKKDKLKKTLIELKECKKTITIYQNKYYFYLDMNFYDNKIESLLFNNFVKNIIVCKNVINKQHIFIIDNLSIHNKHAITFLKKFLSKYTNNVRFIIIINKLNLLGKFNNLMLIRIPQIKEENLKLILQSIYKKYTNKKKINKSTYKLILENCNNNLTKAINLLQIKYNNTYECKQLIKRENNYFNKLFKLVKSPFKNFKKIREIIYEYYILNNINNNFILEFLNFLLIQVKEKKKKEKLVFYASEIDSNLNNINKEIIAYEYFVIQVSKLLQD